MSRVEATREIIGGLVKKIRKTINELEEEEYHLLILMQWYEPDKEFRMQNGEMSISDILRGAKDLPERNL